MQMKKDTETTIGVLETARYILRTENEQIGSAFTELLGNMNKCFGDMLLSLKRYKLVSTKREKLWRLFHKFSVTDGIKMCDVYNKDHSLNANDTFWQLLMDKEFLYHVFSVLSTSSNVSEAVVSNKRQLRHIEKNTIKFVIQKLLKKYAHQKTKEACQCVLALKEMAGKLSSRTISQHHSSEYINPGVHNKNAKEKECEAPTH